MTFVAESSVGNSFRFLMALRITLVKRKYRLLFTPKTRGKPGPKGPSPELISAIIEMKRRNPIFGYQRIADQISLIFTVHAGALDGPAMCRMFNSLIGGSKSPRYLSSDHDPLFRFRQWNANLRILEVMEVKTVPYVPLSHPFVERLIGTICREYLDQVSFWSAPDLQRKLLLYQDYYNRDRVHRGLDGTPPDEQGSIPDRKVASLATIAGKSTAVVCIGYQKRLEL